MVGRIRLLGQFGLKYIPAVRCTRTRHLPRVIDLAGSSEAVAVGGSSLTGEISSTKCFAGTCQVGGALPIPQSEIRNPKSILLHFGS